MQEVELKFDLSPAGAQQLVQGGFFGSAPTVIEQRSTYFDTPDRALFRHDLSLRIRCAGDERVQTVKASESAGAGSFIRQEWEQAVAGDSPELDDPDLPGLLAEVAEVLAPVFEVHVTRHRWRIVEGDSDIEVALDMGTVRTADRQTPICEVELERKSGPTGPLFALARRIDLVAPLHLGVLSKAERGYRLIERASGAEKSTAPALKRHMDAEAAFSAIAAACIRQFRLNEEALRWSRDKEVLHQARVALRRLRTLCAVSKPMLNDHRFDRMVQELKWLASRLGNARDLDILIDHTADRSALKTLRPAREEAYTAAIAALSSPRARALMIDLAEWITIRDWKTDGCTVPLSMPARQFARNVLKRLRKKAASRGRNLAEAGAPERHALRITLKKLRYAAEFCKPLFKGKARYRQFLSGLASLQEQLGQMNDLSVMPQTLETLGLPPLEGIGALAGNAAGRKSLRRASKAWKSAARAKPFWR